MFVLPVPTSTLPKSLILDLYKLPKITTMSNLKPNHKLEANKHTLRDARLAKKRLLKLTQMLEIDVSCDKGVCEVESVKIARKTVTYNG